MIFLSPEEVLALRLKDSTIVELGAGKRIRLLKITASKGFEIIELQELVAAGKKKQRDLIRAVMLASCADEAGAPLQGADVDQLIDVLSLAASMALVSDASASLKDRPPGNGPASPDAA